MAILFAMDVHPSHLITFGSPKVAAGHLARDRLIGIDNHLRVAVKSDVVPKLPGIIFKYDHFGDPVIYSPVKGLYNSHCLRTYSEFVAKDGQ